MKTTTRTVAKIRSADYLHYCCASSQKKVDVKVDRELRGGDDIQYLPFRCEAVQRVSPPAPREFYGGIQLLKNEAGQFNEASEDEFVSALKPQLKNWYRDDKGKRQIGGISRNLLTLSPLWSDVLYSLLSRGENYTHTMVELSRVFGGASDVYDATAGVRTLAICPQLDTGDGHCHTVFSNIGDDHRLMSSRRGPGTLGKGSVGVLRLVHAGLIPEQSTRALDARHSHEIFKAKQGRPAADLAAALYLDDQCQLTWGGCDEYSKMYDYHSELQISMPLNRLNARISGMQKEARIYQEFATQRGLQLGGIGQVLQVVAGQQTEGKKEQPMKQQEQSREKDQIQPEHSAPIGQMFQAPPGAIQPGGIGAGLVDQMAEGALAGGIATAPMGIIQAVLGVMADLDVTPPGIS